MKNIKTLKKILVVLGPNINLMGEREPSIYGDLKYADFILLLKKHARKSKAVLKICQSSYEGELIDFLHKNRKWTNKLLINPAGYTHTSVALRDAVLACNYKFVEFHFSDITKRESFRRVSLFSDIALKTIMGEKEFSAIKGIDYLLTT